MTTKEKEILSSNSSIYVYNIRHNNFYKIHINFDNNLITKQQIENKILENKIPNAYGQLIIKINESNNMKKIVDANDNEKNHENISYDKFIEKGDILVYNKNNLSSLENLRKYVQDNYISTYAVIDNTFCLVENRVNINFIMNILIHI